MVKYKKGWKDHGNRDTEASAIEDCRSDDYTSTR
jgi:hypothetical protein